MTEDSSCNRYCRSNLVTVIVRAVRRECPQIRPVLTFGFFPFYFIQSLPNPHPNNKVGGGGVLKSDSSFFLGGRGGVITSAKLLTMRTVSTTTDRQNDVQVSKLLPALFCMKWKLTGDREREKRMSSPFKSRLMALSLQSVQVVVLATSCSASS